MRADINTIAESCGVSKATVSRVFTGKARVSSAIREKVLASARKLNYSPQKAIAHENITIVVDHLISFNAFVGFYPMILSALIAEVTRNGYTVKIVEFKDVDLILKSLTRAAVLLFRGEIPPDIQAKIRSSSIPLISTNEVIPNCRSVCSDHAQEVRLAYEHFVENGHRRIALVLDVEDSWTSDERRRGYREAAQQAGLECLPDYAISEQYSLFEALNQVIEDGHTGMIVCGEGIAAQVNSYLGLMKVKVPDDISVITSENSGHSRWFNPPHTTLEQDIPGIASKLIETVKNMKVADGHRSPAEPCLVPCKLNVRKSVKKLTP
jgi:LacI family transcriptional regulator